MSKIGVTVNEAFVDLEGCLVRAASSKVKSSASFKLNLKASVFGGSRCTIASFALLQSLDCLRTLYH